MNRGRLAAYLKYQFQDFLMLRAGLPTVLVAMFGYMLWKGANRAIDWNTPNGAQFANQLFRNMASVFIMMGSFLGIARIVADDRSNGYFRFLFSKPVSIERFYLQQWFLYGVGFVGVIGLLGYWLQAFTAPLPIPALMTVMGLTWILVGGVGFLISAVTNVDAVMLVVLYVTSTVLHSLKDMPGSPMWPWLRQVTRFALPTHKLDFIRDQLYAGAPMPWTHAYHVIGYGVIAVVLALVVLRRTSFAR